MTPALICGFLLELHPTTHIDSQSPSRAQKACRSLPTPARPPASRVPPSRGPWAAEASVRGAGSRPLDQDEPPRWPTSPRVGGPAFLPLVDMQPPASLVLLGEQL